MVSRGGRRTRLTTLLIVGTLGALLQAGVAQAAITQTAVTSPSDLSYYYDATGGATGGINVTGTTDSTAPSTDEVDIVCSEDDGTATDPNLGTSAITTVLTGVSLASGGGFSATVPYSAKGLSI